MKNNPFNLKKLKMFKQLLVCVLFLIGGVHITKGYFILSEEDMLEDIKIRLVKQIREQYHEKEIKEEFWKEYCGDPQSEKYADKACGYYDVCVRLVGFPCVTCNNILEYYTFIGPLLKEEGQIKEFIGYTYDTTVEVYQGVTIDNYTFPEAFY